MNKNLKRAIYKKRMSFNKYNRCKNKQNWEIYRKQRNLVYKIKKQSIRNYFIERCAGGPKSKHFLSTSFFLFHWGMFINYRNKF
jgi:hypothetical protein